MATILLVENDPDQRELRTLILERAGHTVIGASNPEQALEGEKAEKAVLDLRLPKQEDGYRLIRELRAQQPGLEIFVVSGYTEDLERRPEARLVKRILRKPVSSKLLLSLLVLAGAAYAQSREAIQAHAPILERRANAIGTESDIPLLMYAERLEGNSVQYTVIFSNEDGGTSTRALMARWGRTTDIEYVYRVWLDREGRRARATIQTSDHKDVDFTGPFEGDHPILRVITDNNMVGPGCSCAPRTALAAEIVDLSHASREQVMDDHPEMYRIAAEELAREGKLRFIGDPRDYLYVEARIANSGKSRTFLRARVKDEWYDSHDGESKWAIERSDWIRTTIKLPHGAKPVELSFGCLNGACRVEEVRKVFFLGEDYRPQPALKLKWSSPSK